MFTTLRGERLQQLCLFVCVEFLRHANCMWEVKQDYEECARDYQEKIQDLSSLMSNESNDGSNEHHVRKLCWWVKTKQ